MKISSWPTPQEYNEALQSPGLNFVDPDLRNGDVELTPLGLPKARSGSFASVYKVSGSRGAFAVRCFLVERPEQEERYRKISEFVRFDSLECTVDFEYVPKGIRVKGNWFPCLKMPWVDGVPLDVYLFDNWRNRTALERLCRQFETLAGELDLAGIAHGDLQHGNIMVTGKGLRLVDYDALFVPALSGKRSLELGHPNYQHPARTEFHYDVSVDNFSCWLIHASLRMLSLDPFLYERSGAGDECILLRRSDLRNPENSSTFKLLLEHDKGEIRDLATLLIRMLWSSPEVIPPLGADSSRLAILADEAPGSLHGGSVLGNRDQGTLVEARNLEDSDWSHRFEQKLSEHSTVPSRMVKRVGNSIQDGMQNLRSGLKSVRHFVRDSIEEHKLVRTPVEWMNQSIQAADSLMESGEYEASIEIHTKAYSMVEELAILEPFRVRILKSLARCYFAQGRYDIAVNFYLLLVGSYDEDEVNQRHSQRLVALYLAVCLFSKGNRSQAFSTIDRFLVIDKKLSGLVATEAATPEMKPSLLLGLMSNYLLDKKKKGDQTLWSSRTILRCVFDKLLATSNLAGADDLEAALAYLRYLLSNRSESSSSTLAKLEPSLSKLSLPGEMERKVQHVRLCCSIIRENPLALTPDGSKIVLVSGSVRLETPDYSEAKEEVREIIEMIGADAVRAAFRRSFDDLPESCNQDFALSSLISFLSLTCELNLNLDSKTEEVIIRSGLLHHSLLLRQESHSSTEVFTNVLLLLFRQFFDHLDQPLLKVALQAPFVWDSESFYLALSELAGCDHFSSRMDNLVDLLSRSPQEEGSKMESDLAVEPLERAIEHVLNLLESSQFTASRRDRRPSLSLETRRLFNLLFLLGRLVDADSHEKVTRRAFKSIKSKARSDWIEWVVANAHEHDLQLYLRLLISIRQDSFLDQLIFALAKDASNKLLSAAGSELLSLEASKPLAALGRRLVSCNRESGASDLVILLAGSSYSYLVVHFFREQSASKDLDSTLAYITMKLVNAELYEQINDIALELALSKKRSSFLSVVGTFVSLHKGDKHLYRLISTLEQRQLHDYWRPCVSWLSKELGAIRLSELLCEVAAGGVSSLIIESLFLLDKATRGRVVLGLMPVVEASSDELAIPTLGAYLAVSGLSNVVMDRVETLERGGEFRLAKQWQASLHGEPN